VVFCAYVYRRLSPDVRSRFGAHFRGYPDADGDSPEARYTGL
jgi:hypothetical protein